MVGIAEMEEQMRLMERERHQIEQIRQLDLEELQVEEVGDDEDGEDTSGHGHEHKYGDVFF